ncbi:MAG: hypothetical protein AMXMBFR84_39500 [Candidatus Hydrogenedentota bacterium]
MVHQECDRTWHRSSIPRYAMFTLPGGFEIIVILCILAIPLAVLFMVIRYFVNGDKERRRLRIEVSKLAHEVEAMRKRDED